MTGFLTRRQFVEATGGVAVGALGLSSRSVRAAQPLGVAPAARPPATDQIAATYYQLLLRHTNWAETQWDPAAGYYLADSFSFAVVLGNAVLLTHGDYDQSEAGVDGSSSLTVLAR